MPMEGFTLDGLQLAGTDITVEEVDLTPPAKRSEWASSADSEGSALVRDALPENRTVKFKLRIEPKASMLLALQTIAALSRKIEECEQQRDGLPLVWTPADGTVAPVTFYVLSGFVSELPIAVQGDSGWFVNAPSVSVELTCKPYAYGTEVVGTEVSSTAPVLTLTVADVPGDVPAEGRLIVTDAATQNRRTVEWGLEQRHYDAATSLIVDSDDMVTTGYAGVQATRTGAYDPNATGNNVVQATLAPANGSVATSVAGLPALAHVGSYRVRARVYATGSARVRLSWQDGAGPFTANNYATPPVLDAFSEVDLGVVNVQQARLGAQAWSANVDAFGSGTLEVDYLTLIPVREGYGRARGQTTAPPGVLVALDRFYTGTGGLNGRTPELGAAWATAGSAPDFVFDTDYDYLGSFITRAPASDGTTYRTGVLGSALINLQVQARVSVSAGSSDTFTSGVIARWVDASNFLMGVVVKGSAGTDDGTLKIIQRVAGVDTTLASAPTTNFGMENDFTLSVLATGDVTLTLVGPGESIAAKSTVLATGGVLASGKCGLVDRDTASSETRLYSSVFVTSTFSLEPAFYSGRTIEFGSSGDALRQNAAGTVYGQAASYRGSRFLLPPAGDKARTSRIAVRAHRNDLDSGEFAPLGDNLTAQVVYRPRYLVVGA